jgi:hypothetical protein
MTATLTTIGKLSNELLLWSLAIVASLPPAIVLFNSQANAAAHTLADKGLHLSTPGLQVAGIQVIPSYSLVQFVGPMAGGSHVYSGFDQTPIKTGQLFTLANGTQAGVKSGFGPREAPVRGATTNHKGVDVATAVGTPLFAPIDGVKVQCWWDVKGGGGQVASIWIGPENYQALHLSKCYPGIKKQGDQIALTGNTGISSGPHLHWEQKVHGAKVHPKRGILQAVLNPALSPPDYQPYKGPSLEDNLITCVIGYVEGAADKNCEKTTAYWGHRDSGRHNQGFFSSTNGYSSPLEADKQELAKLKAATPKIQQEAKDRFGAALSEAALLMTLDLKNQSPDAAERFFKYLPSHDPTPEELIDARVAALTESRRQIGVGGSPRLNVAADQRRRVDESLKILKKFQTTEKEQR